MLPYPGAILFFVICLSTAALSSCQSFFGTSDWNQAISDTTKENSPPTGFKFQRLFGGPFNKKVDVGDIVALDSGKVYRIRHISEQYPPSHIYFIDFSADSFRTFKQTEIAVYYTNPVQTRIFYFPATKKIALLIHNVLWQQDPATGDWHKIPFPISPEDNLKYAMDLQGNAVYLVFNNSKLYKLNSNLDISFVSDLPRGIIPLQLAVNKNFLFFYTGGGHIVSYDAGQTWKGGYYLHLPLDWDSLRKNYITPAVDRLTIDKSNLYLSVGQLGVMPQQNFMSSDSGFTWKAISNPFTTDFFIASEGETLFMEAVSPGQGPLYSVDTGKTWHILSTQCLGGIANLYCFGYSMPFIVVTDSYDSDFAEQNYFSLVRRNSSEFKKVSSYRVRAEKDSVFIDLKFTHPTNKKDFYSLKVEGANTFNFQTKRQTLIDTVLNKENLDELSFSFSPAIINVNEYNPFKIRILFSDNALLTTYTLGEFEYNPESFIEKYPRLSLLLGLIIAYFIILVLILVLKPLLLYRVHQMFVRVRRMEENMGQWGMLVHIARELTFFRLFLSHNRTLNAWIEKHEHAILSNFDGQPTVRNKILYIPLPIKVENGKNELIEKPTPDSIQHLLRKKVVIIQIVGVGGIGKTTLAVQIGRWVSNRQHEKKFNNRSLPILLEEEIKGDAGTSVLGILREKISAWTGENIDETFLKLLLKKKKLLLIIDALSERDELMQYYFSKIHRQMPVNALIITTRKKAELEIHSDVILRPIPLSAEKLLFFISNALESYSLDIFKNSTNQLRLADKLIKIFSVNGKEIPIIPILIKLVIDKIKENTDSRNYAQDTEKLFEEIPDSIPEVFLDYLNRVNPTGNAQNLVKDSDMRKSAEIIARIALGDKYIPQDVHSEKVNNALSKENLLTEKSDPVRRLIDNGILEERQYAGELFFRFSLDPLAEYLAAIHLAKECDNSKEKWESLYNTVIRKGELAKGFLQALELVHVIYWQKFGWTAPEEIRHI